MITIAAGSSHNVALLREPDTPLQLYQPRVSQGVFSVKLLAKCGQQYRLEGKDSVAQPQWTPLSTVCGSGRPAQLRDTNAPAPARFYIVRPE